MAFIAREMSADLKQLWDPEEVRLYCLGLLKQHPEKDDADSPTLPSGMVAVKDMLAYSAPSSQDLATTPPHPTARRHRSCNPNGLDTESILQSGTLSTLDDDSFLFTDSDDFACVLNVVDSTRALLGIAGSHTDGIPALCNNSDGDNPGSNREQPTRFFVTYCPHGTLGTNR